MLVRFLARLAMLIAISFAAGIQPAAAQQILRDSETEALLRDISRPLIEAAGLQPSNVRIVIIGDPEINAFTAGGQIVYLNSGLFTSALNANEVQGVIAHELGHIAGGHVLRQSEGQQQATGIMVLSLLLGAAAMAAGAGDAGMASIMAGQQMAMGRFLAFTRDQESSADQAGATFLSRAGISGRGSLAFFRRLQNLEYRMDIPQEDSYARTHPLNSERIAALEQRYQSDPAWNRPTDPALEERFQRVRAKLSGYVDDARQVLARYPQSDQSIPAHYARAYAWHRTGHPDEAKRVLRLAVARDNDNPFAWYQLGIVYDREGDEARAALATAERYSLEGNPALALPNAERAMMGIPVGTPDWLRAQDISMVSRTAMQQHRRHN